MAASAAMADTGNPNERKEFSVLLVDDDDMDRHYFSSLLQQSDEYQYRYEMASSLAEARSVLSTQEEIFDCILVDYHLRDGTGADLIREVRVAPDAPAIIVLTGHSDRQQALELIRLGASEYLDKRKINKENLSRCIRYGIERNKGEKLQHALHTERQINSVQRDFIAIITHEFRNPIHIINNSVVLIRRRLADAIEPVEKYLVNITQSASQMDNLLSQTIDFAKFDPSSLNVNMESASLYQLVGQSISQMKAIQPQREFNLSCDMPVVPDIRTDPKLCMQILDNIIGNAMKYSPEDTTINLLFNIHNASLSLQIQDHGQGIPAKELDKIGQKFFRASNCGDIHGTGMGLYLVKSLMRIMNGTFEIQSRENVGTVVTLNFPLSDKVIA